jgi:cold shock CspA family protein/ribosome-associated translation inhibitor RaiA
LEIHWVDPGVFRAGERSLVEARIRELTEGRRDVIDVRITARATARHRHGGQDVRITCEARGKQIVAVRERADASLALNEAMAVFERELRRLRERRAQPHEAGSAPVERGVIDRLVPEQDQGFILTDAGERVYFHRNALHGELALETLQEGQRVGLDFEGGDHGPQATVVRPALPGTL